MSARLVTDFARRTGPVRGGATGMLYGLSDPGIPAGPLIAGARPRAVAQRAPGGSQHPNGDALLTAPHFLGHGGREVHVYLQDVYARWPYDQLGIDDYLARVATMVSAVADTPHAARFSWVPFNEPDWIWYPEWPGDRDRFFADWRAVRSTIRGVLPGARIVGPNEREYHHDRLADFLAWAVAEDVLPDVISWHELRPESLNDYPAHYADYRALERSLGIGARPITINEYGTRQDMANPARLIQWISMFEATKVDADLAYWTYAGNLADHAVRTSQANGAWWLLKWYADLTGETVTVAATASDDRLRGTAVLDGARRQATVLFGGSDEDVELCLTGLPENLTGAAADVTVTRTSWSGQEGDVGCPPVLTRTRHTLRDGPLVLTVPGGDPMAAYQVVVTPAERDVDPARPGPVLRLEAENAQLTDAVVVVRDGEPMNYATSGGRDVTGLTAATSAVTFTAEAPVTSAFTCAIFYGTTGVPAQQALYLDGRFDRVLTYPATLQHGYRGRLDVPLHLTAGRHELSLRASAPEGELPQHDIALDRLDLFPAPGPDAAVSCYPARSARLRGGALLAAGSPAEPARVLLSDGATATFFVAAAETGYHDLGVALAATGQAMLRIGVNGRPVQLALLRGSGGHTTQARVHLARGISTVCLDAVGGEPAISMLTLERVTSADRATHRVPADRLRLTGSARLVADPYAMAGSYVTGLGRRAGSVTLARPAGSRPGPANLTVGYANAAKNPAGHYNTDVISQVTTVAEAAGTAVEVWFQHTYASNNFWSRTVPLELSTAGGAITLGDADGPAPHIDHLALSPLVLFSALLPYELLPG